MKLLPRGYAALISVVMVMLTVTAVGLTMTVMSADSLLSTMRFDQGVTLTYLADSCAHDTLLHLRDDGLAYVGTHTMTVLDGNCTIVVTNTTGSTVDVAIDAEQNNYHRLVEQTVDVSTNTVLLWQEVGN